MSNVLEKVRKLKASRPRGGSGRVRGIFHSWKDGDNEIRLIGEFLEVKTHFIAPAPKRNEKGLCRADAFQGDERISQVINCADWDVEKEEWKKHKTCSVCKLNRIAKAALKLKPKDDEKKSFEELRQKTYPRPNLKWNIIDREDPFVLQIEDDKETKIPGLKIATIGMEAWGDIEGIFDQTGFDITDEVEGIDITVNKSQGKQRVQYSARAVLEGKSLKETPLTDEEKAMSPHDLRQICGKQVDISKVVDAMHEEYREILELNEEDAAAESTEEAPKEETPKEEATKEAAPKEETPKEDAPKEEATKEAAPKEEAPKKDDVKDAIEDALEDDEDGLLGGTDDSQKKS